MTPVGTGRSTVSCDGARKDAASRCRDEERLAVAKTGAAAGRRVDGLLDPAEEGLSLGCVVGDGDNEAFRAAACCVGDRERMAEASDRWCPEAAVLSVVASNEETAISGILFGGRKGVAFPDLDNARWTFQTGLPTREPATPRCVDERDGVTASDGGEKSSSDVFRCNVQATCSTTSEGPRSSTGLCSAPHAVSVLLPSASSRSVGVLCKARASQVSCRGKSKGLVTSSVGSTSPLSSLESA